MKKIRQNSKKGFTLVELIVVLVILAVMAAMLVPALTGYIDEARKKKDYNAASEVLTAAQAVAAQYYGSDTTPTAAEAKEYITDARVAALVGSGVNAEVSDISFANETTDTLDLTITGITVTFGDNSYTWDGSTWS